MLEFSLQFGQISLDSLEKTSRDKIDGSITLPNISIERLVAMYKVSKSDNVGEIYQRLKTIVLADKSPVESSPVRAVKSLFDGAFDSKIRAEMFDIMTIMLHNKSAEFVHQEWVKVFKLYTGPSRQFLAHLAQLPVDGTSFKKVCIKF